MLIICDFALKYSLNAQQVTLYFSTILSQLPLLKGAARLERSSFLVTELVEVTKKSGSGRRIKLPKSF